MRIKRSFIARRQSRYSECNEVFNTTDILLNKHLWEYFA